MTTVSVEEQFIGAGDVYLDSVLFGRTHEDNVWRLIKDIGAARLNGVGAAVARTDYRRTRDVPELEFTMVELSSTTLPVAVPDATVTTDGADTVVTESALRRLPSTAYGEWKLTVPGLDGAEVSFTIFNGLVTSNVEVTAADSENPLGPRLTVQGRVDDADVEASMWEIRITPAGS